MQADQSKHESGDNKKPRGKALLHADSLSSDPSDYQSMPNYQSDSQPDETSLRAKKRTSRPRRQPALPNGSPLTLKQQLLQKALLKQNVKQHSLSSSDENLGNDEFDSKSAAAMRNPLASQLTCDLAFSGNLNETNSADNLDDSRNLEQTDFLEDGEEFVDYEARSATECTTNDEMDLESGSLPQAGGRSLPWPGRTGKLLPTIQSKSIDDYLVQHLRKEEILAAKMSKFLSPTSWSLAADGERLLGSIVLKRQSSGLTVDSLDSGPSLGVKIVGGKLNPVEGVLSAYVVKVKKDSLAESVGRLQVGDEVLEWNGQGLRGRPYDEVHAIMSRSRGDVQVEMRVERLMR